MSIASQTAALVNAILDCGVAADTKTEARVAKAGDALTGPLNLAPIASIAAAATTDLATVLSNTIHVSGNDTVFGLGVLPSGAVRYLIFLGTPTLSHNGASQVLPGGESIVVEVGDSAEFISLGAGNWRCVRFTRLSNLLESQTIGTIASASTMAVGNVQNRVLNVTGTTGVVSLGGSAKPGTIRTLRFTTAVNFTNSANLKLPGAVDLLTRSGDTLMFLCSAAGVWECINVMRGDAFGAALLSAVDRAALLALVKSADQPTYRNLLINGNMEANQEQNAAGTVNGTFFVDAWGTANTATARLTTQQSVANPAPGFFHSLLSTVTTAGAPAAGDYHQHIQGLEGTFTRFLQWGAANPIALAVSLMVRSSVAGQFAIAVRNTGAARSYVAPLVVNAANTWEAKSWIIPGDTSGAWTTTTAQSMSLGITMAAGTTFQTASPNQWVAGNFVGLTGMTQLTNTNAATFQITGVQAEPSWVSAFERLQLDRTLLRARRYWQTSYPYGSAVGSGDIVNAMRGFAINANDIIPLAPFPVEMASAPGVVLYNPQTGGASHIRRVAAGTDIALSAGMSTGTKSMYAAQAVGSLVTAELYDFHYTANARI
jgi:hypothetical protein